LIHFYKSRHFSDLHLVLFCEELDCGNV